MNTTYEYKKLEDLHTFCDVNNLLENKLKKNILVGGLEAILHQDFWEMYLGRKLIENKIGVARPPYNKNGNPDYLFKQDRAHIYIEAVAPREGDDVYKIPPVPIIRARTDAQDIGPFEHGIVPTNELELRLTNALKEKIDKIRRYISNKVISADDRVIIAVNGFEAFNGWNESLENNEKGGVHRIARVAFGLNELTLLDGNQVYKEQYIVKKRLRKGINEIIPIANDLFFSGNTTPIDGILFSCASVNDLVYPSWLSKFVYVQNPERTDLNKTFGFCDFTYNAGDEIGQIIKQMRGTNGEGWIEEHYGRLVLN